MLAGLAFALVMHSVQFLLFTLLSPLTLVGTAIGERFIERRQRQVGRRERERRAGDEQLLIRDRLRAETRLRRRHDPDPATIREIAELPGVRLWERAGEDPDLLCLRVGTATLPSSLQLRRGQSVAPAGPLWGVPVVVDLAAGAVGIAGPRIVGRGIARWLAGQLAALRGPGQVELAAFLGADETTWTWLRWLPHLRRRPGIDKDSRRELRVDLENLIAEREAARDISGAPRVVVIVDAAVDETIELAHVLARGTVVGVTSVWLADRVSDLPSLCTHTLSVRGATGNRIELNVREPAAPSASVTDVIADRVSLAWADGVARALAALTDAADRGGRAPTGLVDIDAMNVGRIDEYWRADDGRATAVLGTGSDGLAWIDLVRDGPHALVAGTTGSGKSELLRTLVVGLAIRHPPESIAFVLIDYKGGAAFADCARLPHVTGVVTDLDPQLTTRALRSLACELRRRERLFATVAADDLDDYRTRAGPEPLPRLVIVVDEFAALAAELPDFVQGLIAVAQRGRSLGVHLMLATQRPGSCLSAEIRANTTLRIALRVADAAESVDVIGRPDAARIAKSTPGRAIVVTGDGGTEIQVAHVGGRTATEDEPRVELLDAWRRPITPTEVECASGPTDLARAVDAVIAAARRCDCVPARAPWPPTLPDSIATPQLPAHASPTDVVFGLADRPDHQAQPGETLDLDRGGGVLFAGVSRSGRTTALRSIAFAAARRLAPRDLHIYLIHGAHPLEDVAALPHCVTSTSLHEWDLLAELLQRLEHTVSRRRHQQPAGAQASGSDAPWHLVLIDGWEEFADASAELDLGRSAEVATRLLASAASAGMTIVLTGGRAALAARAASSIPVKYLLRLADRGDYALAGISPRHVPARMPAGRALRAPDAVEIQVGEPDGQPPLTQPARAPGDGIALRPLPAAIALAELPQQSSEMLRIGLAGPDAIVVGVSAADRGVLIVGPPGSGRSTALRTLIREAHRLHLRTVVVAGPDSPLYDDAIASGTPVLDRTSRDVDALSRCELILVDDVERFAESAIDDALTRLVGTVDGAPLVVASTCNDLVPNSYRGPTAALLRCRRMILLNPSRADGELVGLRLPGFVGQATNAGRGLLVGTFTQTARSARGEDPLCVQVAVP